MAEERAVIWQIPYQYGWNLKTVRTTTLSENGGDDTNSDNKNDSCDSEGMCQCEKYSDFEYLSNTVKFTSKSYHFLKEDSQSSDDENKIMRDPKNGKLEFGNIFMIWKFFHPYRDIQQWEIEKNKNRTYGHHKQKDKPQCGSIHYEHDHKLQWRMVGTKENPLSVIRRSWQ